MADDSKSAHGSADMPRPRRVMTEPVVLPSSHPKSNVSSAESSRSEELVETLYSHPSVKIISFTSTQRTSFGPRPSSGGEERPGTLPASSRLERTIAVGPFRIYRAPGSVAFLSCGSALQPILPKSQCWCIDEDNSRFVLQIRRPQYWRIELPVSEPDDQERALVFRDVLDRVLLFEKTQCPFQRSFAVDLPDQPETPIKKKAWTAEGKHLKSSPFLVDPSSSPSARAIIEDRRASVSGQGPSGFDLGPDQERYENQRGYWQDKTDHEEESLVIEGRGHGTRWQRPLQVAADDPDIAPADGTKPLHPLPREGKAIAPGVQDAKRILILEDDSNNPTQLPTSQAVDLQATEGTLSGDVDVRRLDRILQDPIVPNPEKGRVTSNEPIDEPSFEGSGHVVPMNLTRKRMSRALAGRAFTAPPQLTVVTSPPSKAKELPAGAKGQPPPSSKPVVSDENSPVGSTDSFHSVQSWHSPITPLLPSPPSSRPVTPSTARFPHPHENIPLPRPSSRARDNAAYMNTPDTDRTFIPSSAGTTGHTDETASPTPPSPADNHNNHVSPIPIDERSNVSCATALEERSQVQQRPRLRPNSLSISRRALSPLPSAANFFSPPSRQPSQSRIAAVRRLPSAIIQKTMEILLSPPAYLVSLMLKVAAKIAAGEWRGLVFGFGEGGEKIPVQWDYSDGEFSDWSDDEDYAMARSKQSSSSSSSNSLARAANRNQRDQTVAEDSRSWEVD
ncbi:inheritance of peroxisomes protein 1-domain-containing protein [Hypoxylon crocopeplum]|nr:inheritance of peroxisomes protein 1-domain-containing protein [Hypoxylon crocopeplum]